jgi:hypothetical protein
MQKNGKWLTLTRDQLVGYKKKHDAAVKKCAAQLDNAINSKKSAAQLVTKMKSVKAKLGKLPPHFGPRCPIE